MGAIGQRIFGLVDSSIGLLYRFHNWASPQGAPYTPSTPTPEDRPTVHTIRGILQIPFGVGFLRGLNDQFYYPVNCEYPPEIESRYTCGYPEMAAAAIDHFIRYEGDINAVVGHSAGGITAYLLGAMAKSRGQKRAQIIRTIHESLPETDARSDESLHRLAEKLEAQQTQFISVGSPFGGIRFRPIAWWFIKRFVEPHRPGLYSPFVPKRLKGSQDKRDEREVGLYNAIGLQPAEVIDANIIGAVQTFGGEGPLKARLANFLIQGALAFSGLFIVKEPGEPTDRLVPHSSSYLGLGPDREVEIPGVDHTSLIERPDIAKRVANFLKTGSLSPDA